MKVLVIVRGNKLDIEENYWDKISVKGDIDKIYFFNKELMRIIRDVSDKGIIEFYGENLELVIRTHDFILISGEVTKYYIYDKNGKLGIIHNLSPRDFV
jgi:hypothetical protein